MHTHLSEGYVVHALRLSNSTIFALRQMQKSKPPKQQTATQRLQQADVSFIPFQLHPPAPHLPGEQADNSSMSSLVTCQIINPNGAKLIINSNELSTIIQTFLCCK